MLCGFKSHVVFSQACPDAPRHRPQEHRLPACAVHQHPDVGVAMTAPRQIRPLLPVLLACAMGAAFTVTVAKAETAFGVRSAAEAKANYQHDVAACKSRSVDEDTKTCLLEAKR